MLRAFGHHVAMLVESKDNERNLCQGLLTIENTNLDLKVNV